MMMNPETRCPAIPAEGLDRDDLTRKLRELARADKDSFAGFWLGRRFFAGDDVAAVAESAYGSFATLGRSLPYPGLDLHLGIEAMRSQVIDSALILLHAPDGAWGEITSGGTESNILAMRTCLNRAISQGRDRSACNVIVPSSAHPCFDKAAELLGLDLRRIRVAPDLRADVDEMAAGIDANTIMLVGSAPSYPYGLVDDIDALSRVAADNGLWLHVDACMSGLLAPFMEMNGVSLPPLDFRVAGVDSVSADLHKHGYSAKGASLILYRSKDAAPFHRFRYSAHPFAPMTTTTLAGTAPAAPIASAWAVMQYLGISGYRDLASRLASAAVAFADAIERTAGFEVFGNPKFSVLCFGTGDLSAGAVAARLMERRWFVLEIAEPPAIQVNVSVGDDARAAEFAAELRKSGSRSPDRNRPAGPARKQ